MNYSQTLFIQTTLLHQMITVEQGIQIIGIKSIKSRLLSRANANNVNQVFLGKCLIPSMDL